ncbi:hypothetical protein FRB98_008311 [Tulasnella sp. 332]|nr:hypothetical protein FRB98_008311 [Tulasnella sp. 332]
MQKLNTSLKSEVRNIELGKAGDSTSAPAGMGQHQSHDLGVVDATIAFRLQPSDGPEREETECPDNELMEYGD